MAVGSNSERISPEQRFYANVDRNGPIPAHCPELGPCHVWTGGKSQDGYGHIYFDEKVQVASRVAFFLAHGRWPDPFACHHCDNPPCVNDAHLFEGTQANNNADMRAKGRSVILRGERHGRAKITEQDVRDIRANYALCRVKQSELAARFGVTQTLISSIVRRKAWSHVV